MKRPEKMKLVAHYRGSRCACGGHKHDNRWLCLSCSERLKDSPEGTLLTERCSEHFEAARALLARAADGNPDAPRHIVAPDGDDRPATQLFLVGQAFTCEACAPGDEGTRCWEFQGVFTTEERAVAACIDTNYFVALVELNKPLPKESERMPKAYYPLIA